MQDVDPRRYVDAIRKSGLTIYQPIEVGDPNLWIPTPALQQLLASALDGLVLEGLPIRTRSKVVKEAICRALGYPVPGSFKKTQPRFPGQAFDTYTQKSNNLQVWNEELSGSRRYVLIRVSDADVVTSVKVVTGDTLALLDTTGTLTQKYQARCVVTNAPVELVTKSDTEVLAACTTAGATLAKAANPVAQPKAGEILPIAEIFDRLSGLIGYSFADAGAVQERNRGAGLHRAVCQALGYASYQDDGQFPDVRHQVLEVKLQTSPTIDLGLVRPDSEEPLDVPMIGGRQVRHCDVRYAVFFGRIEDGMVHLTNLIVSTGASFFTRFPQFQGKVLNAKLQIPLPAGFFNR